MQPTIEATWRRVMPRYLFLLLLAAVPMAGTAQSADIKGPVFRTALIELFTSEGCSSFPPAEKWLNGLADRADLWSRVVPVAFHVDYWDYIGWPDRFASREHSRRQQTYHAVGHFEARFAPAVDVPESIELHVARLGFDFATEVEAGENRGRTLTHDFVVLGWSRHALKREGEGYGAQGKLPSVSNTSQRQALAVWVSVPGDPYPIQAAGNWLEG